MAHGQYLSCLNQGLMILLFIALCDCLGVFDRVAIKSPIVCHQLCCSAYSISTWHPQTCCHAIDVSFYVMKGFKILRSIFLLCN